MMVEQRIRLILLSTLAAAFSVALAMPLGSIQTTSGLDAASRRFDTSADDFDGRDCNTAAINPVRSGYSPNLRANLLLADCSFQLSDSEKAIIYASRAVELEPGSSEGHLLLGRAYGLEAEKQR